MSKLQAVAQPDSAEVASRYYSLQRAAEEAARIAWVGTLVMRFTNEELHLLADRMSIGETLTLRRLGLLAADEGFDGRSKPRRAGSSGDTP